MDQLDALLTILAGIQKKLSYRQLTERQEGSKDEDGTSHGPTTHNLRPPQNNIRVNAQSPQKGSEASAAARMDNAHKEQKQPSAMQFLSGLMGGTRLVPVRESATSLSHHQMETEQMTKARIYLKQQKSKYVEDAKNSKVFHKGRSWMAYCYF